MIHRGVFGYVISFFICSLFGAANLYSNERSTLTFQQRVNYQRAIERVYWNHRTWPKENASVKPSFDTVMPPTTLQIKVEDYLLKSNALAVFWNNPITPKQLQIEMDRMAKESKRPEVLHELWQACDNDPYIIAECLVRPILADRLLRHWYSYDKSFHSGTRTNALLEIHNASVNRLKVMSGSYSETLIIRDTGIKRSDRDDAIYLDEESWKDWTERLHLNNVPLKHITPLREDTGSFYVTSVLKRNSNSIKFATVRWPKKSFQEWWNDTRQSLSTDIQEITYSYRTAVVSGSCANDTWNSSQFPAERMGHTAVWTGSEMIVWGGEFGLEYLGSGSRYDPGTDTWALTSDNNAPVGRRSNTAVWTGSEMIIWGGYHFSMVSSVLNSGARYNPVTDTWMATSLTNVPEAREYHTAVWTGNEMMIWGGDNIFDNFNNGGRYNPISDTWIPISITNAPAARKWHSTIWTGSEMIIWGGQGTAGLLNTGGRYNSIADSWTPTSTTAVPLARYGHTAVWTGTQMIVWGGLNFNEPGESLDSGGSYDPILDSWQPTTMTNAPTARSSHTAVWTGSEMIIWGGFEILETDTGARYSPSSDSWVPTTMTNAPKHRTFHTAVWTGDEMIVWGGTDGQNRLNSGGRYDPVADSWIPTGPLNTPSGRAFHTSVWTGSEMIIWGGFDHSEYLSDGAAYNPAVDSWTTLSMMNAASKRREHTAVWSGTEMIVWGGWDGNPINTGGKYNPTTDTWSNVTMTNAPAVRTQHTAMWTGSEMIIWGGFKGGYEGDGGRYNPSADSWSNITNNNAPVTRYGHSAIWTGNQMIVWGGVGCVEPPDCTFPDVLNTGGRYDPLADAWLGISSNNAPSARSLHTAVWSGNVMIIWGGGNDFSFSDGARYNPSADSWSAISDTSSPSPRVLHTSVWTGQSMITWGGAGSDGVFLGDGADYNPASDSWTPISSSGAPLARDYHTTVWTGDSMIVWGGFVVATGQSNTYGSYCRNDNCPFINLDDTLPDGTVGALYNGQIIVTGGTPPYTFSVSSGALPAGLTLDSATGIINGTPTSAGSSDFEIIVTDSLGCSGTRSYTIIITNPCPVIDLDDTLPDGTVGVPYNGQIIATGGTPPYTFAFSSGAPPHGLLLDPATGVISGTPNTAETADFGIIVTDALGWTGTRSYTIIVAPASCLFCDDFQDGVLDPNWSYPRAFWNEAAGFLSGTPTKKKAIAIATPAFAGCLACYKEVGLRTAGGLSNKIWVYGWYFDKKNTMELLVKEENDKIILKQRVNGLVVTKSKGNIRIDPNQNYIVRITFDGNQFFVSVNGNQLFTLTPAGAVPTGTIGFAVKNTTGSFDYITIN